MVAHPRSSACSALPETDDDERHARFEEALRLICSTWSGNASARTGNGESATLLSVPPHHSLPVPAADLSAPLLGRGEQPGLGPNRRNAQLQHALLAPPNARAVPAIPGGLSRGRRNGTDCRQSPGVRRPGRRDCLCPRRAGLANPLAAIPAGRKDPRRDA